jgi:6-phosphogluconolactonase
VKNSKLTLFLSTTKATSTRSLVGHFAVFAFTFCALAATTQIAAAEDGAVYVMTNKHEGNSVQVFKRGATGGLRLIQDAPTQGLGTGATRDPLMSQGALAISQDGQLLFAVNPATADITSFRITSTGLAFASKVGSGGLFPVSVTEHNGVVYVVNQLGIPTISGYTVNANGQLQPIAGSIRELPGGGVALPAEVKFNPDGSALLVTEKGTDEIDAFPVQSDGRTGTPSVQASSGRVPFGFTFTPQGSVIVTETNGGLPDKGTVSSYSASGTSLTLVSGSVPSTQTATCWVDLANQGQTAFVVNTVSGTISSYNVGSDGHLTLAKAVAGNPGSTSTPIDLSITPDGQYLYVIKSALGAIGIFRVNGTSLTPINTVSGLPLSIQGIVAR